jgi:cysteine desulfurase
MIYLDNNSTTLPYPQVVSVITQGLQQYYANPFTQYEIGKQVAQQMDSCRSNIKKMLGISKKETLIFTASATESNNMVIRGSIEHSSVYQTCMDLQQRGKCSLSIIPTNCQGLLNLSKLAEEINKHHHHLALICIILANNEVGVIQDLKKIRLLCKGHFLHVDATQYVGKYPLSLSSLSIQSLTFGSHKFHGPRLGALYLQDAEQIQNCCCTGGRSEQGLRSGTPNIAYIMGMEKALRISLENMKRNQHHVKKLRDGVESCLMKMNGVKINCQQCPRLYNTLSVVLPIHGNSKKAVEYFNQHHICVNVGSACNRNARSRILEALGLSLREQKSTLRISFSPLNTKKECDVFLHVLTNFLKS